MYSKIIFQGALPFGLAFAIAWAFVNIFSAGFSSEKPYLSENRAPYGTGMSGGDFGSNSWDGPGDPAPNLSSDGHAGALKILSKPHPRYSDMGRANMVQGTVILRVTFLAGGQIGGIQVVKGLPDGLTEEAIKAARRIEFEPAWKAGGPLSVTKQVEYSFEIY